MFKNAKYLSYFAFLFMNNKLIITLNTYASGSTARDKSVDSIKIQR
ncbi:hypothetical protein PLUTE_a3827 [Pseudoalteromonas luteoviolacea DSM 6061]|nr:hypothetical protein [Pseudoalteromonas luteoviolacea DSM 6061]